MPVDVARHLGAERVLAVSVIRSSNYSVPVMEEFSQDHLHPLRKHRSWPLRTGLEAVRAIAAENARLHLLLHPPDVLVELGPGLDAIDSADSPRLIEEGYRRTMEQSARLTSLCL